MPSCLQRGAHPPQRGAAAEPLNILIVTQPACQPAPRLPACSVAPIHYNAVRRQNTGDRLRRSFGRQHFQLARAVRGGGRLGWAAETMQLRTCESSWLQPHCTSCSPCPARLVRRGQVGAGCWSGRRQGKEEAGASLVQHCSGISPANSQAVPHCLLPAGQHIPAALWPARGAAACGAGDHGGRMSCWVRTRTHGAGGHGRRLMSTTLA